MCPLASRVSFVLDKNCWVCAKWLLHSTVTAMKRARNGNGEKAGPVTLECSNHFAHTQQFLSNIKFTLLATPCSELHRICSNNKSSPATKIVCPPLPCPRLAHLRSPWNRRQWSTEDRDDRKVPPAVFVLRSQLSHINLTLSLLEWSLHQLCLS